MTERIINMALAGTAPREIAVALGIEREAVYTAITMARRRGVDIPRFKGGPPSGEVRGGKNVRIPRTVYHVLHDEALRRGLPGPGALVTAILTAVCEDRLFDAVLEGGDDD